jgi:hypothetical protein
MDGHISRARLSARARARARVHEPHENAAVSNASSRVNVDSRTER